jgi:hypothetical protein
MDYLILFHEEKENEPSLQLQEQKVTQNEKKKNDLK